MTGVLTFRSERCGIFACLAMLGAAMCSAAPDPAWLRYTRLPGAKVRQDVVVALDDSPQVRAAQFELIRGIDGITGQSLRADKKMHRNAIVLEVQRGGALDSYRIAAEPHSHNLVISGANARGVLYGAFAFLNALALGKELEQESTPAATVRWTNEWDNLDGSIERGYGGRSFFFEEGHVVEDLRQAGEYARLLASTGINGCTINNVNANPKLLTPEYLPQIARIADAFRPWGVQLSLSVDLGSPKSIGGLDTFDPLDPRVAAWWRQKVDEIYKYIPDFGGFVLKADSEGRVGPSSYGRTHADAANVLAAALEPHGGIVAYRGFVYNHHLDWHNIDWKSPNIDRARAAYDNFHPLDGKFAKNAYVQIKYGPIDFQVREPVSPLLGALPNTNKLLELQITQEYLGQQRHLCYLAPMWKQVLDFDLRVNGGHTPVKGLISGFMGVASVGRDWLGSDLAMANLYAFGRLAWNPNLDARAIVSDWTRLTFGNDPLVLKTIVGLQMESWPTYEGYTGVLGLQTLTDILHSHYQPNVGAADNNGWGQWIHATHEGVGMDRTVATGTGYIGQYSPDVARVFESLDTMPENLLLFMHHVPYTYKLHNGDTVIQYIYDSHYAAAAEAQTFPERWKPLRGRVDEERYERILKKLEYQAGDAIVWRDSICTWFERESGIPDEKGRVGHHAERTEAEAMQLAGYTPYDVVPPENASGGKAVICPVIECSASFRFEGTAGEHIIDVEYFDENTGDAKFALYVNNRLVRSWTADMWLPTSVPNGDTSVRMRVEDVDLKDGDTIRITGTPQGGDQAALDYVAVR